MLSCRGRLQAQPESKASPANRVSGTDAVCLVYGTVYRTATGPDSAAQYCAGLCLRRYWDTGNW